MDLRVQGSEELVSQLEFYYPIVEKSLYIRVNSVNKKKIIYYDPQYLDLGNSDMFSSDIDMQRFWSLWQKDLTILAAFNQEGKCRCGNDLSNCDLHHALISKADIRGIKDEFEKGQILHHSYNVVLICKRHHHREIRKKNWDYLCSIYGKQAINYWYASLPLTALRKY